MKWNKLICYILVGGIFLLSSSDLHSLGYLTVSNPVRTCVIDDADGLIVDPGLSLSYDAITGTHTRRNASADTNKDIAWEGGNIYVSIDKIANNNIFDTLSCVVADPTMTASYSVANRLLTITAGAGVTAANIQATLRSVRLRISGQHTVSRIVRFWIAPTGFVFSAGNVGRLYAMVLKLHTTQDTFKWTEAESSVQQEPWRFGMKPYFATVTSDQDFVATQTLLTLVNANNSQFLGAKRNPANSTQWIWIGEAPETGKIFWQSSGAGPAGSNYTADGLNYSKWSADEPSGLPQNAMQVYTGGANGLWDDINGTVDVFDRYIVAYGGRAQDTNYVTVVVQGQNSLLMGSPF